MLPDLFKPQKIQVFVKIMLVGKNFVLPVNNDVTGK